MSRVSFTTTGTPRTTWGPQAGTIGNVVKARRVLARAEARQQTLRDLRAYFPSWAAVRAAYEAGDIPADVWEALCRMRAGHDLTAPARYALLRQRQAA